MFYIVIQTPLEFLRPGIGLVVGTAFEFFHFFRINDRIPVLLFGSIPSLISFIDLVKGHFFNLTSQILNSPRLPHVQPFYRIRWLNDL